MRENVVKVFIAYAHEDENLLGQLQTHLAVLQREGLINTWHDHNISPGEEWAHEIDANLNKAEVILLLISADFLASDFCYSIEMKRAIERHKAHKALVIPIILRPCQWKISPLRELLVGQLAIE